MMNKALRRIAGLLGATLALGLLAVAARAQLATLCAEVKLEILQEATLEREAFDANLKVNNNLPDQPLTDLRVNVFVKDEAGNPADALFFIKVATLTNVNAVDGTGVVQSSSTAEIRWLIIPSTGAGGSLPGGKRYAVKATINGTSAGAPQSVTTFDDYITVYPQPSLKLEYVLPYEVFGDEPLTAPIEPIEPFPLGVRVTNVGYGIAKNFKIDSAQPKIVENKQGLLIDFKLLGTVVGGKTIPDTLLVPFGDVAPGGVGQASWIMSTTLSGRFVEFTSTFTHAAELGGQLTSLIQSVTTYTLLKDVLVDLSGRDATPDFLVNASLDRGAMQDLLNAGGQPPAELILESDQPTPIAVVEVPAALSGTLGGSNAALTLTFTQGVGANVWVHSSAPFTPSSGLVVQSARSSDGRVLNLRNVWISKHFRKSDNAVLYRLNILDRTTGAASYTINFDPASLDAPPGAVTDLAAATGGTAGSLALAWTAPGEDGFIGHILGGRYLIQHSSSPAAVFSPELAQVSFATSTDPGRPETLALTGLLGNATTYLRLWTQDTGGAMSAVSNAAAAYVPPNPPHDLILTAVGSSTAHGEWQGGDNNLPIAYRVYAATAPGGAVLSSSPLLDAFTRSYDFTGLLAGATIQFFGFAQDPVTLTAGPTVALGSTVTIPIPLDTLPPRTSFVVGLPSLSSSTVFISSLTRLSLSAVDDALAVGDGAGFGVADTFVAVDSGSFTLYGGTFTLSAEGLHAVHFYSKDVAGNTEAVRSSTVAVDATPPSTEFFVNGVVTLSTSIVASSTESLSLAAADAASGVSGTFFSVDGATPTLYVSTFGPQPGAHYLSYRSIDNVGNAEAARTVLIVSHSTDTLAPSLSLLPAAGSTTTAATPALTALYSDAGVGVDVASVHLFLDGSEVTSSAAVTVSSAVYVPAAALSQGTHTVAAQVADFAGNRSTAASAFFLDSIPPVTSLLVDGLAASATSLVIISTDSLGFTALDSGTGVAQTLYALDGGSETVYLSTFTLPVGPHALVFLSRDAAGNLESGRDAFVMVLATAAPPAVGLVYPAPPALGVERAVGGSVNVRGSVFDTDLRSWTLSVAPGVAASTGFATLASGTTNITGLLKAWNTASLSGPFTLRLSAKDALGDVSIVNAPVFVGKPVINFAIGKRTSNAVVSDLKNPQGIVVRPDGLIWVAVDDDSKLLLVTPTGALVAAVGDGRKYGHDDHDDDHDRGDDHGRDARTLKLKHPRGLSLDAGNNLYVADRDNDRVVKLSPDGSRLLREFNTGLKNPNDMAVDVDGLVYVADTDHRRVRVFRPDGTVMRDIPTGSPHKDSRPWGVALSSEGLWVSDRAWKVVYLFNRGGSLLKVLSGVGRVRGASVDHVEALYVVDREDDRVRKFDPKGAPLLSFGPRSLATTAERQALKFLADPADAAIGPDGALWVADSGHDRIVRYVLPAPAGGHGVAALSDERGLVSQNLRAPVSRLVDPADGGKVERDDGTGVRVPGNALASELEISVQSADDSHDADAKRRGRLTGKLAPASEEVEFGPAGLTFEAPVTLTLAYDAAQIELQGLKEEKLAVHYWDQVKGGWEALDSTVDKDAKIVSAQTTHFSVYQAMGGGFGVAAADASFGLKAAYVFPNPVRGTNQVTIRIQPGLADSVEVHVYDVSGRKVHSSEVFNLNQIDDGNGLGTQYTYDHVWDVSGVGSGVYTYVITARKAGQGDLHKTGKLGVVR